MLVRVSRSPCCGASGIGISPADFGLGPAVCRGTCTFKHLYKITSYIIPWTTQEMKWKVMVVLYNSLSITYMHTYNSFRLLTRVYQTKCRL